MRGKVFLLCALLLMLTAPAWADTVNIPADGTPKDWADGNTYVITGPVMISDRIIVSGAVTLILSDGCTLTAKKGISVNKNQSLTISGDILGTGKLIAEDSGYNAAIGGDKGEDGGYITINGGTVTAASNGNSAGIGGGMNGSGGNIEISGGTVTATSQVGAALRRRRF